MTNRLRGYTRQKRLGNTGLDKLSLQIIKRDWPINELLWRS